MHRPFSSAPHISRRNFFEVLGSGVTGSYLAGLPLRAADTRPAVTTQNKAISGVWAPESRLSFLAASCRSE